LASKSAFYFPLIAKLFLEKIDWLIFLTVGFDYVPYFISMNTFIFIKQNCALHMYLLKVSIHLYLHLLVCDKFSTYSKVCQIQFQHFFDHVTVENYLFCLSNKTLYHTISFFY